MASAHLSAQPPGGGMPPGMDAEAMKNLPGMTWESLNNLPDLLDTLWIPEGIPDTEQELLQQLPLPAFLPEYEETAKYEVEDIISGVIESPVANCGIIGQPRLAWYPNPLKFLYSPGNVMIYSGDQIRAVSVSGLRERQPVDPDALVGLPIDGSSSGIWEGDTLVIFTSTVREDVDTFYGIPNDPELEVTERYRLLDDDRLERITIVDAPSYFEKPWEYRVTYQRTPLDTLASTVCEPEGGWFFDE